MPIRLSNRAVREGKEEVKHGTVVSKEQRKQRARNTSRATKCVLSKSEMGHKIGCRIGHAFKGSDTESELETQLGMFVPRD